MRLFWTGIVAAVLLGAAWWQASATPAASAKAERSRRVARAAQPDLRYFDRLVNRLRRQFRVPGAALAISKDGKLFYAKGFGYADLRTRQRVTPTSMFRIASVSKPLAAVVVLHLVERGKLRLNTRVYRYFRHIKPPKGRRVNRRIYKITVRDLLRHTSGQSSYRRIGFRSRISSPMQPPLSRKISRMYRVSHPPRFEHVIGFMKSQPLTAPVGTHFKYSNYGYALLGKLVERVTGMSFERYAKKAILHRIGARCMHFGRTLRSQRKPGEVAYYDLVGRRPTVRSVFPGKPRGPFPYAGRHLEGWGAAGAWIASAVDVVRFVNHVDGRRRPALLRPATIRQMVARQVFPEHRRRRFWYGLGWRVQKKRRGAHWYHSGASNGGAAAIMVRTADGFVWSGHFNRRLPAGRALYKAFNRGMWRGIRRLRRWRPGYDLFSRYRCR